MRPALIGTTSRAAVTAPRATPPFSPRARGEEPRRLSTHRRASAWSMSASRSSTSSMPTERRTIDSGTSASVPFTEACVISDG